MRIALALAVILLSGPSSSAAPTVSLDDDADDLVGVWRLQSFSLAVRGEPASEIFGAQPKGYLIFTPEGRMMTVIARADRKPARNIREQADLLQSMVAYTGRYTVADNRITTRPDVSWNEIYTGTEQVRFYTLIGDTLQLTTSEQPSGVLPGKRVVATLTYARER
jgi:Lipocalin-like domain